MMKHVYNELIVVQIQYTGIKPVEYFWETPPFEQMSKWVQ